jgi:hypothetical protein
MMQTFQKADSCLPIYEIPNFLLNQKPRYTFTSFLHSAVSSIQYATL